MRAHGYSLRAAAREVGLDHSNLRKKLLRNREAVPDAEKRHQAAEERILSLAEELSETAAEKLIADVENDRLRPSDLVKTYSAATNQVAAKRRWSQSAPPTGGVTKNALAEFLGQIRVEITPPDPAQDAIDVTPSSVNEGDTGEDRE
jgi:hypothetical protein